MLASVTGSAPAWSTGDRPLWEHPAVQELILARSLEGGPTPLPPPPAINLGSLVESLSLVAFTRRRELYTSVMCERPTSCCCSERTILVPS